MLGSCATRYHVVHQVVLHSCSTADELMLAVSSLCMQDACNIRYQVNKDVVLAPNHGILSRSGALVTVMCRDETVA